MLELQLGSRNRSISRYQPKQDGAIVDSCHLSHGGRILRYEQAAAAVLQEWVKQLGVFCQYSCSFCMCLRRRNFDMRHAQAVDLCCSSNPSRLLLHRGVTACQCIGAGGNRELP